MLKNPNKYQLGKTIVLFVRHGDRVHNLRKKEDEFEIPGPGLNELGKKQAREVANKLSKFKGQIDALYCSEMARAIETAKEISKKIGKEPKIVKGLSEISGVVWKKKLHTKEFWNNYKKHLNSIKVLDLILEKNKGKFIVIVAHGNLIKGLIFKKARLNMKQIGLFHHHNCSISCARFIGKRLDHIYFYNSKEIVLEE